MINYDCPTPYQFLLGTVQHLEVMSLLKRQVLQVSIPLRYGTTINKKRNRIIDSTAKKIWKNVSIPLRYGTTIAKTISIATTLIVSIPLRYGTTVVISGHIQTGSYVSIPLRYGTT